MKTLKKTLIVYGIFQSQVYEKNALKALQSAITATHNANKN